MSPIVANTEKARQIEAAAGGVAVANEQGTTIALTGNEFMYVD